MNILKSHKTGVIKVESFGKSSYMHFMYKAVNIYTIIANAIRLTDKELLWFCCFVYISNKNIDKYLSGDALQIYENLTDLPITKANISNYLKRIKKKGWVKTEEGRIIIPDFFRQMKIGDQIVDFQIRLYNENIRDEDDR